MNQKLETKEKRTNENEESIVLLMNKQQPINVAYISLDCLPIVYYTVHYFMFVI